VRAEAIWQLLNQHKVTHLCGAPIVMSTIMDAEEEVKQTLEEPVEFFTAAAPPPEKLLTDMHNAGFNVTHLYGLTEVYGPAVINDWHSEWSELPNASQAALKARQGVRYHALEGLNVFNSEKMEPVPRNGKTIGEVMFRGNIVMKGYLKNDSATRDAMKDGWFHSGDLGVVYPDGYIQLKDRLKDIIISGGENISSIEIEEVLYKHSYVSAVAVVAAPHEKWGETPCAFVELKTGCKLSSSEFREWCKQYLAGFKLPSLFVFGPISKTSTGKIQKVQLRATASEIAKGQSEK
jgi:fatty-acyl-CoA synthase